MTKQLLLSPVQSGAFGMGRVLILLETWKRLHNIPVEFERLMLIDFAVQHPRTLIPITPEVKLVVEGNQLAKGDFGDLFAHKHFSGLREKFMTTVNDLVARTLVSQSMSGEAIVLEVTDKGLITSAHFSSAYSLALRALADVFCSTWKRKSIDDLSAEIRTVLPHDTEALITLGQPFGEWISAGEKSES